ncbi:phytoene/squalene synthase family protein [Rhizobium paknamense]|uniref:Phytoene synthase n=1 Tax=Rhizobium paknamense TaxID=1206817 RepID=A0ABU0IG42_9HYPH|nr:phytoene/squalene synthase family protein [Rhizobium paknamense]MDQ0457215.1 phytoene synthase [Rhizobium paknamense]
MAGDEVQGGDHILTLLRESDRDRYLACLLSPAGHQPALAALYAFNAELARVRDLVREALPGEIRLQYWRDLLAGQAHGETGGNPLAAALLKTIADYRLPVQPFQNMIDARVTDLYDDPIGPRSALEGYAGETASALIQLASLVLDAQAAAAHAEVAGHAGVAQAIAGLLLLMPQHRARGQLYVPDEILAATGLDRDSFLAGEDKARIGAAIEAFAGLGLDHLAKARSRTPMPAALMPAYLPVALAGPVLRKARRAGAGLFEENVRPAQWRRQILLLKAQVTRRF